jgi:hypothetical protein
MQSTGGVADRFAPFAARLERRLPGGLPSRCGRAWVPGDLELDGDLKRALPAVELLRGLTA